MLASPSLSNFPVNLTTPRGLDFSKWEAKLFLCRISSLNIAFLIFFRTRMTTHLFHCFLPLQSILLLFSVSVTSPIHLAAEQLCARCRLFYHAVKWEIDLAHLFSSIRSDIIFHPLLDAFFLKVALRELHSYTLWEALSFKVVNEWVSQWVRHR